MPSATRRRGHPKNKGVDCRPLGGEVHIGAGDVADAVGPGEHVRGYAEHLATQLQGAPAQKTCCRLKNLHTNVEASAYLSPCLLMVSAYPAMSAGCICLFLSHRPHDAMCSPLPMSARKSAHLDPYALVSATWLWICWLNCPVSASGVCSPAPVCLLEVSAHLSSFLASRQVV